MKINKTLIILSLLLVFCISLSAVSATEDISVNDTTVESSAMNEEINAVGDEEIHYFSKIMDEIKTGAGIFYIEHDYIIDETWTVSSFRSIAIDGQGHTIYGNGNQAFYIGGNSVEIRNLNFVNCSDSFVKHNGDIRNNAKGGAIHFYGVDGFVTNCSFVNCSANDNGGAIYFENEGDVRGCSFENCVALDGGAIYFGQGDVYDCNFVNCSANDKGGAIYFSGKGYLYDCNFVNCSANKRNYHPYSAIYDIYQAYIFNCSFENCRGKDSTVFHFCCVCFMT